MCKALLDCVHKEADQLFIVLYEFWVEFIDADCMPSACEKNMSYVFHCTHHAWMQCAGHVIKCWKLPYVFSIAIVEEFSWRCCVHPIVPFLLFPFTAGRCLKISSRKKESFREEPTSTPNATTSVVEILDAKYNKADLPSIVKNNCVHLSTSHCNSAP